MFLHIWGSWLYSRKILMTKYLGTMSASAPALSLPDTSQDNGPTTVQTDLNKAWQSTRIQAQVLCLQAKALATAAIQLSARRVTLLVQTLVGLTLVHSHQEPALSCPPPPSPALQHKHTWLIFCIARKDK